MKKGILAIFLTLALVAAMIIPMALPVAAVPGTIIAGNPTIDRTYNDSWVNFYLVDMNVPFAHDSMVTGWNIYAGTTQPVGFMVYRLTGSTWSVVYDGSSDLKSPTDGQTNSYTLSTPVAVKAGDFVGLYFGGGSGTSAVDFSLDSGGFLNAVGEGTVNFTLPDGLPTAWTGSSYRTYSVNAVGITISLASLTPPVAFNPVGNTHTVTATLDQAVVGVPIAFTVKLYFPIVR